MYSCHNFSDCYPLNMCSLSCVSYASVKLLEWKKMNNFNHPSSIRPFSPISNGPISLLFAARHQSFVCAPISVFLPPAHSFTLSFCNSQPVSPGKWFLPKSSVITTWLNSRGVKNVQCVWPLAASHCLHFSCLLGCSTLLVSLLSDLPIEMHPRLPAH